jgi:putative DNA methylase
MSSEDRRLIEDFLPIRAVSVEMSREKFVREGPISTLRLWWARLAYKGVSIQAEEEQG